MANPIKHNQLLPWYVGIGIIAIADIIIAYQFYASACEAPGLIQAMILLVVPAVYLGLMYLTFKSQP